MSVNATTTRFRLGYSPEAAENLGNLSLEAFQLQIFREIDDFRKQLEERIFELTDDDINTICMESKESISVALQEMSDKKIASQDMGKATQVLVELARRAKSQLLQNRYTERRQK